MKNFDYQNTTDGIKLVLLRTPMIVPKWSNQSSICPPLGLAYLGGGILATGSECEILDMEAEQLTTESLVAHIKQNKPDVICVYSEKSAINLKDLIGKYSLVDVMTQTNLMCLSKKISSVLGFIKWKKIIFFNPGEEEFFLNKVN